MVSTRHTEQDVCAFGTASPGAMTFGAVVLPSSDRVEAEQLCLRQHAMVFVFYQSDLPEFRYALLAPTGYNYRPVNWVWMYPLTVFTIATACKLWFHFLAHVANALNRLWSAGRSA